MGQLVKIANGIEGSSAARSSLTVTETGGHDQLGLLAAVRSRNYDPADTARPTYGAEELYPLDAAALAARSGAEGPATNNVVRHSNLATSWTPVLELRKAAGTYLTHRGSYRLWVRVYSADGSAVKVRSVWDVGDIILPVENDFDLKAIPTASNFHWLDLGELRLDRVPSGAHRWTGQIHAKGTVGGEDIDVDAVAILCTDEGYLKLRAPQLSATASVASFGPRSSGTLATDTGGYGGTVAWSNPGNAAASDDSWATAPGSGQATQYLKATNFGFSIPTGATINGVKVEIERSVSGVGVNAFVDQHTADLVKAGTIQTGDRTAPGLWGTTDTWVTMGGESDLWGVALTPADVNNSGFGVATWAYVTGTATARIDHIRVTITYTPSTTLPQDAVLFANQSAELAWNGNSREDSTGTAYGPVSEQIGDLLRLPAAGSENRPTELTLISTRGDFDQLPDAGPATP